MKRLARTNRYHRQRFARHTDKSGQPSVKAHCPADQKYSEPIRNAAHYNKLVSGTPDSVDNRATN